MKILIADDNDIERLILTNVLQSEGHEIIAASTGTQAIDFYFQHKPQLILLDVLMPDIDGYDVALAIKNQPADSPWVPIIFLTSITDAEDLAKCIEVGGDDFVSKPIDRTIIRAKINAFNRIAKLYETIEQQKSQIEFHNEHLIKEQETAKRIFNNIAYRGCLGAENINYHLSPVSIFNGDLLLAAETPVGGMRVMMADFTGHGLPAAIGALPASEIFYGMTRKGFSLQDLMREMNSRLHQVLPRGVFCCVIVADINPREKRLTIWNAGAPPAIVLDKTDGVKNLINSSHLPIGIQTPEKFNVIPTECNFDENCKLLAFTDGITESTNQRDEMLGEDRVIKWIGENYRNNSLCDRLIDYVIHYTGKAEQADDLSLIEIDFPVHFVKDLPKESQVVTQRQSGTLDSTLSLCLRGTSLNHFDPIPLFLQVLLECKDLASHRTKLFTILSELYNNALDHGVLGLKSDLKNDSEGFERYYRQRVEKLNNLSEGFISISFDHRPTSEGGEIIFDLKDSGEGFNFQQSMEQSENQYSGRGIHLIRHLSHSVEYFDQGKHVRVTYRWNGSDRI